MKTCAGCDVDIDIRMMHPVQTPQGRYRVYHYVLQIDNEIHCDNGGRDGDSGGYFKIVKQAPAVLSRKGGHAHGRSREQKTHNKAVQEHQAEVVQPTHRPAQDPGAAWCDHFPHGHDSKRAEKETEPDGDFILQYKFADVHMKEPQCRCRLSHSATLL